MSSESNRREQAIREQVEYFAQRRPVRMEPAETPYVKRHFDELTAACRLGAGEEVCEWGAGLGRFSRQLLKRGAKLTAIELSPTQAAECRELLGDEAGSRVEEGDVLEVLERGDRLYDLTIGFFMLHHLPELPAYFRAAAAHLKPSGRAAFVEPNPYNPLYPVQIALTPGMRWKGEAGIYRLTPGAIRSAAQEAGFARVEIGHYGALPRAPYNALARFGCERVPERLTPLWLRSFQTIVAWR